MSGAFGRGCRAARAGPGPRLRLVPPHAATGSSTRRSSCSRSASSRLPTVSSSQMGEAPWVAIVDVTLGVLSTWRSGCGAAGRSASRCWCRSLTRTLRDVGAGRHDHDLHRGGAPPVRISAPRSPAHAATTLVYYAWRPDPELSYGVAVLIGACSPSRSSRGGCSCAPGGSSSSRCGNARERAEEEQQLRVAQARQLERARIAREMHDVLAHRISLLSLHAGRARVPPRRARRRGLAGGRGHPVERAPGAARTSGR